MKHSKFVNFIKRTDLFGTPPTFKINGETKYNTVFGGVCTIISLAVIAAYGVYLFVQMVAR